VAKLSHPNIVTIYDVGEDLDLCYIAMEYLEGEDLEQYTEKVNSLPVRESIDIVSQVCDALDYAHSHGVVHRDIKPGNIMVLGNGRVKVTDFGIARATESSKTRTGEIKGTPPYMSPEQLSTSKVDNCSGDM
jgi:serine/threonine-protein kinase